MQLNITDATRILTNTPSTLRCQLANLDERWVTANYGPDTFSPFDVIGHLIHGEQHDWITRLKTILDHGTNKPFDPFDRYAMYEESTGKSIQNLLDEFEDARRTNLKTLDSLNLTDDDLAKQGTHPALGTVTAAQLIATWAVHDLNHIHQIAKCMARQYRDQIGPWREYITFIDR